MKKKSTVEIGVLVFCFMMMTTGAAWSAGIPSVPNGTITDTSTGLVWLKNSNCFGQQYWNEAVNSARYLKSGDCGLADGSTAGTWRIPTKNELQSRFQNKSGFTQVQAGKYWTSTILGTRKPFDRAWSVNMENGEASENRLSSTQYVWPVRNAH